MAPDPRQYGRSFADVYDEWYTDVSDRDGTVRAVTDLAAGTPVLELGSGTGRLARPLAEAGARVIGLDASREMHARFRAGGHSGVELVEADMAFLPVRAGSMGLVLIAFNTVCNLADRERQQTCLHDVARVLSPGGHLVIETFVPPEPTRTPARAVSVRDADAHAVVLTATEQGADPHHIVGHHIELREAGGVRVRPWELRAVTPADLDTMTDTAGLERRSRWSDWAGAPFDAGSDTFISIYARRP